MRTLDQRERRQDVVELAPSQLIQLRDARIENGQDARVGAAREETGESGDRAAGARGVTASRDGQALDDGGGDVRRDAKTNEVVDDEAVEQTAQKELIREPQRGPK